MNFDNFNEIEITDKDMLLSNAKEAEMNIRISPYSAITNARAALERLCKSLIKANNSDQIRPANGQPNLATMIDTCLRDGLFTQEEAAANIRKNGNDILHPNKTSQKLHVVNEKNVNTAMGSVRDLYLIFSEAFKNVRADEFDELKIPFGNYEIVRPVKKSKNEIIVGDYNYFVKDPHENYYYFQIYHKNSNVESENQLGHRGILAGNTIKGSKRRKSYLLDMYYPNSELLSDSDREYVAYSVYSDSMLLSETKSGMFSDRQIVQIACDLLNSLMELRKIGNGISHRNIQPGNIIITPMDGDYMAGLVNMETAKIEGNDTTITIYGSLQKTVYEENPYLPLEVIIGDGVADALWNKADVYSVAKVMVYCKDHDAVKAQIDEKVLYDLFPEEIADLLADVLGSSLKAIDDAPEFMEKLEDAIEEL